MLWTLEELNALKVNSTEKTVANQRGKSSSIPARPFLKWAGGKTQLLSELTALAPKKYGNYLEPFLGGGAMFFRMKPSKAVLSDFNQELILSYQVIRDNVEPLIEELRAYRNEEKFYYEVRSRDPETLTDVQRAARMIFLNKTCFNGLYRVNKKGQFNVPYGHSNRPFLDEKLLRRDAEALKNVVLLRQDYLKTLQENAAPGDFVFLDPPYQPVSKYADFKRYTRKFFYEDDQIRLRDEFRRLVDLGCHVLLTNSDAPFILNLYKDFEIRVIETRRAISSNPKTRRGKDIIVIGRPD